MKLPLLLNYKPRLGVGPTVMLAQGSWKIESNHIDSELRVALGIQENLFPLSIDEIHIDKDEPIKIAINSVGSESSITIYATRI